MREIFLAGEYNKDEKYIKLSANINTLDKRFRNYYIPLTGSMAVQKGVAYVFADDNGIKFNFFANSFGEVYLIGMTLNKIMITFLK
jgi:hypothetical protein